MMPRDPGDLQHSPAQVKGDLLAWPVSEPEELPDGLHLPPDHGGVRPVGEQPVPGHMIAVGVGVRDHELVARVAAGALAASQSDIKPSTILRSGESVGSPRYPAAAPAHCRTAGR